MKISAVIPVFNGAPYVATAVESALAQIGVDLEVIVVDDGSTDETPAVLRSFGQQIRVVRQENRGLAAARNSGIRASRAEYLAFLDSDDSWEPSKSRKQLDYMEATPDCGLVFCDVHRMDESGKRFGIFFGDRIRDVPTGNCLEQLLMGNFVIMPAVMLRRSVLDFAGLFNETLPAVEDYDMWLRIAAASRIGLVPEPLASYREWPGQMSKNRDRMLDCEVRVLEAATGRHPALSHSMRVKMRRRFATLHDESGYQDLQDGELRSACSKFLHAARHDPLWAKPYRHLLAVSLAATGLRRPKRSAEKRPPEG